MALASLDVQKTAATLGSLLGHARDHSCCLEVRFERSWNGLRCMTDLKARTNADRFGDDLETALASLFEHLKPTPAKIATVYDAKQLAEMFEQVRKAGRTMLFVADFRKPGGNVFSCAVGGVAGGYHKKSMGNDAGFVVFTALTSAGL